MSLSWTMDKIGPMCRSVEDCVLVFNAIYGPDGRDETVADAPFSWGSGFDPTRLRVGYVESEFERFPRNRLFRQPRSAEGQLSALRVALNDLRDAGVNLEPIELPQFPAEALRLILDAEAAAVFDDLTRNRGIDLLTEQGADAWPNNFRASRLIPAVEYIRAQRARTLLAREMDEIMSQFDLFLSPARSASLTMTNLTGHPALAMKAGFSDGLPVALMMTGRLYDEETMLQVARVYERVTNWHTMHPTLDTLRAL
jgi:Asp-tRNA(Asn)/Glu-tRNA(Gln) amidotransferase A subunit family amidase